MRTLVFALALASVSEAAKTEVKMHTKAKMHSKAKMHMKDGDGDAEAVQGDGDDFDQAMAGPTPEQQQAMAEQRAQTLMQHEQGMAVKRAKDQHSMMSQFMKNFGANMKMAVLSDSQGDMPEEERQNLMEGLREKGAVAPQEDSDDMEYFPTMKRQRPRTPARARQSYGRARSYAQPPAEEMQYQEPAQQQAANLSPDQIAQLEEKQAEQQDQFAAEGRAPPRRRMAPPMPMDDDAGSAALRHLQQLQARGDAMAPPMGGADDSGMMPPPQAAMAPPMADDGDEAPAMPAPAVRPRPRPRGHMLNAQGRRLRHHHRQQEAEAAAPQDGAAAEESAGPKLVRDEMGRPMPLLFADQPADQAPAQPAAPEAPEAPADPQASAGPKLVRDEMGRAMPLLFADQPADQAPPQPASPEAAELPVEPQAASAPVAPQAAALQESAVLPVKPETKLQEKVGLDGAVPVGGLPQEHGKGRGHHHHHHHKHHKHHPKVALAEQKSSAFARSVGAVALAAVLSTLVVV